VKIDTVMRDDMK